MSFHPIVFVYFLNKWKVFDLLGLQKNIGITIFIIISVIALIFSGWTFIISQRFQKPFLFDRKTEEEHQDDLVRLTKAVELQTEAIQKQTTTLEA